MARDRLRRTPRWLRVLLPAVLILAWVGIAGIGGPYFGKVDEVSSNDQTSYLPASADATQVSQVRADFAGNEAIPAIVLYVRRQRTDRRRPDPDFGGRATSFAEHRRRRRRRLAGHPVGGHEGRRGVRADRLGRAR